MSKVLPVTRSGVVLAFVSSGNLGVGVALQFAGVLLLGAGPMTDAYFAAQAVPLIFSTLISAALVNNLVPILVRIGREDDWAFASLVLSRSAIPIALGFAALALTAQWWVPMLFFGANSETVKLTIALTPLMCAISALNNLAAVAIAGHYARGRFILIEGIQLAVAAVALCAAGIATQRGGIIGFTYLQLARACITGCALALPVLGSNRRPIEHHLPALWASMRQIVSGTAITKLGPVIDRTIASWAPPGMITSLSIGQQVVTLSTSISERLLTRTLLVSASEHLVAGGDSNLVLRTYRRQLAMVLAAALAASALAVALAVAVVLTEVPVVDGLLATLGHLDIVILTAIVALPAAAGQLSAALMYALGEVRTISRLAIVSFVISSAIKLFGFYVIGVYAVVAGMFLYQAGNWVAMHISATRIIAAREWNGR